MGGVWHCYTQITIRWLFERLASTQKEAQDRLGNSRSMHGTWIAVCNYAPHVNVNAHMYNLEWNLRRYANLANIRCPNFTADIAYIPLLSVCIYSYRYGYRYRYSYRCHRHRYHRSPGLLNTGNVQGVHPQRRTN